jgi:hypothetical protein
MRGIRLIGSCVLAALLGVASDLWPDVGAGRGLRPAALENYLPRSLGGKAAG